MLMAVLFWRDDVSARRAERCLVRRAGEHRRGRYRRAAVAGGGVDRRHAQVVAAGGHLGTVTCRCRGPKPGRTRSSWVPFDAAKGEEGVSVQGSLLIVLLLLIGADRLEGPREHRRGREPLDLDRTGSGRHDAARGRDAADAACRRSRIRAHRAHAGGRPGAMGRAAPSASTRGRCLAGLAVGILALRQADLRCCWWLAYSSWASSGN